MNALVFDKRRVLHLSVDKRWQGSNHLSIVSVILPRNVTCQFSFTNCQYIRIMTTCTISTCIFEKESDIGNWLYTNLRTRKCESGYWTVTLLHITLYCLIFLNIFLFSGLLILVLHTYIVQGCVHVLRRN